MQDLTNPHNRQTQERLFHQAHLEELEQLYDSAPCGYHSLDAAGTFVRINQTELNMLGYDRQEIIGKVKFSDLLTPESLLEFQENFPKFKQNGYVNDLEFDLICKDGRILPISLSAIAIKDGEGNFLMTRSVVIDISDRRRMERQLQQSQHLTDRILNTVPYIICIYDYQERQLVYTNQNIGEVLGYPADTIARAGDNFFDSLFHPDEPNPPLAAFDNLVTMADGEVGEIEYRIRHASGEWCWHHARTTPFARNESGRVTQALIVAIDITTSKQSTLELERTENRLRYLFAANPAVIYACNAGGDYGATFVSENISTVLGYHSSEFLAEPGFWSTHIHPDDRDRIFSQLPDIFDRNYHVHEYRFLHQNGRYIWLRDELKLIRNAEGEPLEIIGYLIDIGDRKDTEQTMREQADLLDIAPDAIFVRDLEGKILFWNQGAAKIYGWETAEAIGRDCWDLIADESTDLFAEVLSAVLERETWQGELITRSATGTKRVVSSRHSLMRDAQGHPKSILVVDTDITESKQLEAQFYRTQRLESLGTLASGIAHDLNNILTPILGIVEILAIQLPDVDPRTSMLLQILKDSTNRGADLVKQILSFTRGVEGKLTTLQIHHIVREIRQIAQQSFPKNIELSFDCPKELWTIEADSTLIHQVLMNLCVNARDAMPDGGKLTLFGENITLDENYARIHVDAKQGNYIVVSITDTGSGIPADIIDRIFDPFFTTKDVGKGTGLGLSTSSGIVRNHGGFINVYSDVGQGTCFKIYLPASAAADVPIETTTERAFGHGELIMVVDDEGSIREIASTTLETYNYRTILANDGIEAIAIYAERKHEIDAILLDLMMPALDAVTIVKTLYKLNPQVKIISMSGLSINEQTIDSVRDNGVKAFLAKPFATEDLLNVLAGVLAEDRE